jgi:hypothetical protein
MTIQAVVERFKHFVEEQAGWRLFWNDDRSEKPEEAAQLAFLGVARGYCEANNVVLDREVNLGRGPVDFKFSNGYEARALLEFKKLHNGRFWNGLLRQLPSYSKARLKKLRSVDWSASPRPIHVVVVDARRKRSASKL